MLSIARSSPRRPTSGRCASRLRRAVHPSPASFKGTMGRPHYAEVQKLNKSIRVIGATHPEPAHTVPLTRNPNQPLAGPQHPPHSNWASRSAAQEARHEIDSE